MTILDILEKDAFEGETIDPHIERQTEVNFYCGAPPQWLNFYLAEKNEDKTHPSCFIKRDGYEQLYKQINKKKSKVILNHMPGSGGTTLAMQLLWDFRKSFKCAVLVDPISQRSLIPTAVVDLYIAGNDHKTVLLLVQDENVNTLRESFVAELAKRKIDSDKAVFVILNCVRVAHINDQHPDVVYLGNKLTDNEKNTFDDKKKWLNDEYTEEKSSEFHGFNIMLNNFSQDYVRRACDVFKTTDCRPPVPNRALQLTACLCLLNSYVPGSFFPKISFDKLLSRFEETMNPFSHLMVSYKSNGSVGQQVLRMAHPMIAEQFLHAAGVHRWAMALTLLKECTEDPNTITSQFIKDLLIKRQNDNSGKNQDFSRLILDIMTGNAATGKGSCLLVLTEAVKKFPKMGQYPQALSRFYYLKNEDFINAEKWAKKAIEKATDNSCMADTLGRVYKHFLNKKVTVLSSNPKTLPEVFDLAKKAFQAFKRGEDLAGEEHENSDDLCDDSDFFNYRPKLAYLQVANILFGSKDIIKLVATQENKSCEYENLISPLPKEIKERARFINKLLSYSKISFKERDRDYVLREARKCFKDYTGEALPKGLGEGPTETQLRLLHETWQNDTQEPRLNLKTMVENIKSSFHETHERYFRSRYLLPLLYLETSDGNKVKVCGEVRCCKVYTTVGDEEIQLSVASPHLALWKSEKVSFDLGFTIKGPTAYNIQGY